MIKSVIKGYHSPDIEFEAISPFANNDFGFLLQVFVGIDGEDGAECFNVFICTPIWIAQNHSKQSVIIGLHTIIVQEYNHEKITKAIEELFCLECTTWDEVSNNLSYYGLSELDYNHWTSFNNSVRCGAPDI